MAYWSEIERETAGRWIAELLFLPGVLAFGRTRKEALAAVEALALRVLANRQEVEQTPVKSKSFSISISS